MAMRSSRSGQGEGEVRVLVRFPPYPGSNVTSDSASDWLFRNPNKVTYTECYANTDSLFERDWYERIFSACTCQSLMMAENVTAEFQTSAVFCDYSSEMKEITFVVAVLSLLHIVYFLKAFS
jgi:hypothetical protein